MTLLIAGYEHEKSLDLSEFFVGAQPYVPEMNVNGLFAISDSAITVPGGSKTLLSGFRKVYVIEARLWEPEFYPDGSFIRYSSVHDRQVLFIGFAGSTLTAQHILNCVSEHLENLRISCSTESGQIKYKAIRHCEPNPLTSPYPTRWDEDTFTLRDFSDLLAGSVIADTVEHSINRALASASRHKLSIEEFDTMHTDLVCGLWCPTLRRHELYLFPMKRRHGSDGILYAYTEKRLLRHSEVAVLGLTRRYEAAAQERFDDAISTYKSPACEMARFLEGCIDEMQGKGCKVIDRPVSHICFKEGTIIPRM